MARLDVSDCSGSAVCGDYKEGQKPYVSFARRSCKYIFLLIVCDGSSFSNLLAIANTSSTTRNWPSRAAICTIYKRWREMVETHAK